MVCFCQFILSFLSFVSLRWRAVESKSTVTSFRVFFFQEFGDLLFGVSYLPTAQRLSVSVIKASDLKYLEIVDSIANFS